MKNSIIIPHRGRPEHLKLCLWSIERSADYCGSPDYEVVIVEPEDGEMPVFNKAVLLNRGMERATGEVLTFLDVDAIVGREWMRGVESLQDAEVCKACYRVRYLDPFVGQTAFAFWKSFGEPYRFDLEFGLYDAFPLAWESWKHHDLNRYEPNSQPHGNSQFSMRAEDMEGLRWDESYVGKGFEDLDMMRQIERKFGDRYRAVLDTRPERCMFHLKHSYDPEWGDNRRQLANRDRYVAGRNGEEQMRANQRRGFI